MGDKNRLEELKSALQTKIDEQDQIMGSIRTEEKSDEGDGGVGYVVTTEQKSAFQKSLDEAAEIRDLIEMEEKSLGLSRFMDEPAGKSIAEVIAAAQAGKYGQSARDEIKSIGDAFLGSEVFKTFRKSGGYTMNQAFEISGVDLGSGVASMEKKDIYTATPGTATTLGFGRVQVDPIVPQAFRTTRVRDLFPVQSTDANLIDFFRVSGFTNGASVVPERASNAFATKPQSSIDFEVAQAPVRLIAHWEVAHRNVLDDEPQLRGVIDNELLYGLRLHEDYQILSGTGTSEDLTGILNTTGIQSYAKGSSPEQGADAIRKAMTKVMLSYYEPTGVVLHPNDWEGIELIKDSQNRYIVAGSVAVGAEKRLWQIPVVDTPAIPENTGLVGAFGLGAQLYDRMLATIRIAEQHEDFFVRNAVVILAEERLALAVKRPESFCKVTGL